MNLQEALKITMNGARAARPLMVTRHRLFSRGRPDYDVLDPASVRDNPRLVPVATVWADGGIDYHERPAGK